MQEFKFGTYPTTPIKMFSKSKPPPYNLTSQYNQHSITHLLTIKIKDIQNHTKTQNLNKRTTTASSHPNIHPYLGTPSSVPMPNNDFEVGKLDDTVVDNQKVTISKVKAKVMKLFLLCMFVTVQRNSLMVDFGGLSNDLNFIDVRVWYVYSEWLQVESPTKSKHKSFKRKVRKPLQTQIKRNSVIRVGKRKYIYILLQPQKWILR